MGQSLEPKQSFLNHGILSCSHLIPRKRQHKAGGLFSKRLLTKLFKIYYDSSLLLPLTHVWLLSSVLMPREDALYSPSIKYTYSSRTHGVLMNELVCPCQGARSEVIAYPGLKCLCLLHLAPCFGDICNPPETQERSKGNTAHFGGRLTSQGGSLPFCFPWPAVELFGDLGGSPTMRPFPDLISPWNDTLASLQM